MSIASRLLSARHTPSALRANDGETTTSIDRPSRHPAAAATL